MPQFNAPYRLALLVVDHSAPLIVYRAQLEQCAVGHSASGGITISNRLDYCGDIYGIVVVFTNVNLDSRPDGVVVQQSQRISDVADNHLHSSFTKEMIVVPIPRSIRGM